MRRRRTTPKPEWMVKREQQIQTRIFLTVILIIDLICIALFVLVKVNEKANASELPSVYAGVAQAFQNVGTVPVESTDVVEIESTEATEVFEPSYSEEDLYELAKIIECEAGADYISLDCKYYVGSVVLNRTNYGKYFPSDIHGTIFQSGQYSPTFEGGSWWYTEPDQESIDIAKDLLENGSKLPPSVIYQANFVQGAGVYCEIDGVYFCYED